MAKGTTEKKKQKGLIIPKGTAGLPPKEVRWSIPGDLWAAVEIAAKENEVDPVEVVRFALSKALRAELKMVKRPTE